ncbi:MAG: hypothetical protein WA584_09405 [Pyrinomonadaceae bacterium]
MSCFSTMSTVTAASEFDLTKHVNYTAGMILGVDDFTQEFAYLSGRDRWMAREALGYGTVSGLRVRVESGETEPRVMVEPGVAISPRGQLICVPTAQCAYLNQWLAAAKPEELSEWLQPVDGSPPIITSPPGGKELTLYVVLCYRECLTDNAPIPGEPCRNENELMAASRVKDDYSLELRFEAPKQPEEDAVRRYSDFLRQIPISDDASSTPIDDFLDAIRDEFLSTDSPVVSPPVNLNIHPADVSEYMRLAFRLWTTELRNVLSEKETGCAVEMTGGGKLDDCILLAELRVPLTSFPPNWKVSDDEEIELIEDNRPFLLHLRMLQEWMLNEPNDHGDLTGLEDDDHPQYLLINGSRAMTGSLKMGGKQIINLARGTSKGHAVNFEQAIKVDDPAGGDLTGKYPDPTIAKLQGKELSAGAPAEGQILFFRTGKWITAKPITDHDELAGLGDDDHKQYLPLTGIRPMTGDLKMGGKQITNLAAGTANGQAVNFEQTVKVGDAAGGDLGGTYPNPTLAKLLGKALGATPPTDGQTLIFKGGSWIAETPAQAVKVGDAAGGDLSGTYPNPTLAKLMGKTLGAAPTIDGQVLTFKGGNWVAEAPASGGVTDHSALTGLANDDHKQYLALTGSRAMTGILKLGNNKITGLAAGTVATDAVNLGQVLQSSAVAGGDLSGTFANLSIVRLQGKSVSAAAPNVNDALVWNGTNWVPKPQTAQAQVISVLPIATVTRRDNNFFEIWFNVDVPENLVTMEKFPDGDETRIIVEGETDLAPNFLSPIPIKATSTNIRNVVQVSLQKPEMAYMRFKFMLGLIKVVVEGTPGVTTLQAYANKNSIRFLGSEKEDSATVFVRVEGAGTQFK